AIRERAERRVDVVKIMSSGGVTTAGTDLLACQFPHDEVALLVDEAHAAGLPVTVHAHGLAAIEQAIEAGVDGIEHCACLTPSGMDMRDSLLESLAQRSIAVCPTVGTAPDTIPSPAELAFFHRLNLTGESVLTAVGRLHRAGVRVTAGTDGGIAATRPHGIVHAAISVLVASGVPAPEALASATSIAAQVCGVGTSKGRLRAGYDADLLLVDGNPLSDVRALTNVATVMVNGRWADIAS
ncbi:MAG: amidohydrolase family protein, partial [Pseudonocardiaceae bacterium]